MGNSAPRHAVQKRLSRGLASTGVLSLAMAGGAFAVAGMGTASAAASATLKYSCTLTNFGTTPYNDPWTVTLTADIPSTVEPGETISAPAISATVVTGKDATDQMHQFNIKTVEGTADASYSVGTQAASAGLAIAKTDVPASGSLTTVASGKGESFTAPSTPSTLAVKVGDFSSTLTTDTGFVLHLKCTPAAGANTTIGTIKVAAPAPTTTTTTPAPTTTTTSTPTTTTPAPTTTTPEPTTSTPDPTTPDPTTSTPDPTTSTPAPTTSTSDPTTSQPSPSSSPASEPSHPGHHHGHHPGHGHGHHTPGHAPGKPGGPVTVPATSAASVPVAAATHAPTAAAGPKVDTDYVSAQTANTAGVALAAAGAFALGGAVVAGRRSR